MSYLILGIESSCDDTSAAVIRDEYLLSNVMASQEVHRNYGGVIPELASRAHQQNILPVVDQALKKAGVTMDEIDALVEAGADIIATDCTNRERVSHETVEEFIKKIKGKQIFIVNADDVNILMIIEKYSFALLFINRHKKVRMIKCKFKFKNYL